MAIAEAVQDEEVQEESSEPVTEAAQAQESSRPVTTAAEVQERIASLLEVAMAETAAMADALEGGEPAAAAGVARASGGNALAAAVRASWGGKPRMAAGTAGAAKGSGLAVEAGIATSDERMARAPAPPCLRMKQTARKSAGRLTVATRRGGEHVEGEGGTAAAAAQSKMFDPGGSSSS